jgi:hypothetical protein
MTYAKRIFLLLIICATACIPFTYKPPRIDEKKDARILYEWSQEEKNGRPTIEISIGNEKLGQIVTLAKPSGVFFISVSGRQKRLWRYFDYSDISKITQSKDGEIIRLYHWYTLIISREYVTEFNVRTFSLKTYSIKWGFRGIYTEPGQPPRVR